MARKTTTTPESRRAQGEYAVRVRELGHDHPKTEEARTAFRSEKYLAAVRAAVESAPPIDALAPEQRARLVNLLKPVVVAAEAGAA